MFVKEIKDYDENSCEATVIVSDGKFEIACYADSLELKEKREFQLVTFLAKNFMLSQTPEAKVEKKGGYYEYKLTGRIINKDTKEIEIGNIKIKLDGYIPTDLNVGDFVEFECLRVDFSETR